MGFLLRLLGNYLFQFTGSWLKESSDLNGVPRGRMDIHTCLETLHCRKMWTVDSELDLHRAHLEGPAMPLFLIFSDVSNLLCTNNQMKEFTLRIQSDFQTFFHMLPAAEELKDNFLYPSFTV